MSEDVKQFTTYKAWREAFATELKYTRQDMARARQEKQRELENATIILGIIRELPNGDTHQVVIDRVYRTPEGITIFIK